MSVAKSRFLKNLSTWDVSMFLYYEMHKRRIENKQHNLMKKAGLVELRREIIKLRKKHEDPKRIAKLEKEYKKGILSVYTFKVFAKLHLLGVSIQDYFNKRGK